VTDDSSRQPISDSKHWESECGKDPGHLMCNTSEIRQDLFQLWKARSVCPPVPRSTSTVHPNSRNDCSTKPKWKLYPDPSLAKLCSREGESCDYGKSSELPNHGAWYISHQFYSIVLVTCYLFFSAPMNLRVRFLLRGVVLSHSKISNFGVWLKFTKF
jgi:hypothetical protein